MEPRCSELNKVRVICERLGNRQGRGRVALDGPCLAALWLTQPDKFDSLFKIRTFKHRRFWERPERCIIGTEANGT